MTDSKITRKKYRCNPIQKEAAKIDTSDMFLQCDTGYIYLQCEITASLQNVETAVVGKISITYLVETYYHSLISHVVLYKQ